LEQNIWQTWPLVFLPTKLSVLLKNNFLRQSKNYKNHFKNSNFWSRWSCDIQFHKYAFHINGWSDDKLHPQIFSVGTTANAALTTKLICDLQCFQKCHTYYGISKLQLQCYLLFHVYSWTAQSSVFNCYVTFQYLLTMSRWKLYQLLY
jgi:hypothetical protein